MKKAYLTTYKVGTIGEFAAWTKRVVRDARRRRAPCQKKWFDSESQARRAAVRAKCPPRPWSSCYRGEPGRARCDQPPPSRFHAGTGIATGRKEASLSRTLKRFAELGIVAFRDGAASDPRARTDRQPGASRYRPCRPPQPVAVDPATRMMDESENSIGMREGSGDTTCESPEPCNRPRPT